MPVLVLILIPLTWLGWLALANPYDIYTSAFIMLAFECAAAVLMSRLHRRNRP